MQGKRPIAKSPTFRRSLDLQSWQRNLLVVWPGLLAVACGLMAVIPMLPLFVEERFSIRDPAAVRAWAALAFAAAPLTAACCGPVWGAIGDRVGRKAMVLRAMLAIGLVLQAMPLAPDPTTLTVLRVLQGAFAGYIAPAMALVTADAPLERTGRALARLQVALALGLMLGPLAGAEVGARLGRAAVFHVAGGLALLAAVPVWLFAREESPAPRGRAGGVVWTLVADLADLLRLPRLAGLLGLFVVVRIGTHMPEPFVALWVRELGPLPWLAQGGDPASAVDRTTALAFAVLAVAQFVFTPLWGRAADRFGPLGCLVANCFALGLLSLASAHVPDVGVWLVLRCLAAACMAGGMTLTYAAVARRAPPSRRGTAFALVQSSLQLGLALGPLTGALAARGETLRPVFTVAGMVLLAGGLGLAWLRKRTPRAWQGVAGDGPPAT